MRYMEVLMKRFQMSPDKTALIDPATDRYMSYGELDEVTSKVYAYLADRGIGREDFVMIDLPRGIDIVAVSIGVWRAGAACVIVEEGTSGEKKDYIYYDCGCRLLIGRDEFGQILSTSGQKGYVKTEPHDALYAVYTSGTTGNPKGVIREYGTLEEALPHFKYEGDYILNESDVFMVTAPLSYVVGPIATVLGMYLGFALVVAPFAAVRDPDKLLDLMSTYRVTSMSLTPSYLRLNPRFNPEFRILILSGEAAGNIYREDVTIYCAYAQSEIGYLLTVFKVDRAYELTPSGKSRCAGHEIYILDDDGNDVTDGGIGEICFDNPYFRGYMNLPEETGKALRGGIYHSGDMGRILKDGSLLVLGRGDDMVKIHGNRVEPGEIERTMKDVFNLSWAAVRIFTDEGKTAVCAYYTDDHEFDPLEAKRKLSSSLPSYMIPTHFIRLAEIPLNTGGKLSSNDLPRPDLNAVAINYSAPQNNLERILCKAAENVLGSDRVGILDDLYALGLDSLSAIMLIAETGLEGLTTSMVFRGLTPQKIAEIYQQESVSGNPASLWEQEEAERKKEHPLLKEQLAAFDWQLCAPHSTMNNFPLFVRLGDDVDLPRLAASIESVMEAHGAFSTILSFNEEGEIVQKFEPDLNKTVIIEDVSEAELMDLREHLIVYFKLIGSPFYRCRIFRTESAGYLFFDIHHLMFDGRSGVILLRELADCYRGTPPERDHYFANLSRLEKESTTKTYIKAREYYTRCEAMHEWSKYPKPDGAPIVRGLKSVSFMLPVCEDEFAQMMKRHSIGKNAFMLAVSTLTIAAYNNAEHISLQWTYNGRENPMEGNIIGMLIRDITFYIDLERGMTVEDFLGEVRKQIMLGLSYSCYPHTNLIDEPNMCLCVIYHSQFGKNENMINEEMKQLKMIEEELPNPYDTNEDLMDMEICDTKEGTEITITCLPSCYKDESIDRFCRMITKSAQLLVKYAKTPGRRVAQLISDI